MSWGTKIVIALIIFGITVISITVFFMTQKVDMVTDNYYEKELKYQEQINRIERTNKLSKQPEIQYDGNMIKIIYPNIPDKVSAKDFVLLYRPSDNSKDIKIPVNTDTSGTQVISAERLDRGVWRVQVNWTSSGSEYYTETIVNVR